MSLVLSVSNRSDILSVVPCVVVYGLTSQHTEKAKIVLGIG